MRKTIVIAAAALFVTSSLASARTVRVPAASRAAQASIPTNINSDPHERAFRTVPFAPPLANTGGLAGLQSFINPGDNDMDQNSEND